MIIISRVKTLIFIYYAPVSKQTFLYLIKEHVLKIIYLWWLKKRYQEYVFFFLS